MGSISRLHPESKTGLIKFIEDNFHEIDEYMFIAEFKDGTNISVHDFYSYRNAVGSLEMSKEGLKELALNGDFVPKERGE